MSSGLPTFLNVFFGATELKKINNNLSGAQWSGTGQQQFPVL